MDVFKNMEVILLLCFGVLCAAAWQQSATPGAAARTPLGSQAEAGGAPAAAMQVVVVTAKRLTAAEKQAFAQN